MKIIYAERTKTDEERIVFRKISAGEMQDVLLRCDDGRGRKNFFGKSRKTLAFSGVV